MINVAATEYMCTELSGGLIRKAFCCRCRDYSPTKNQ